MCGIINKEILLNCNGTEYIKTMNAKELRLGNLIFNRNSIVRVNYKRLGGITSGNNEFTPIPLTEEWLLKFGFNINKSVEEFIYWKKFDMILDFELFRKIGFDVFYIETRFNTVQINTVHQLQNLYFALTGEELEIK